MARTTCSGCGEPQIGCVCAEIEADRREQAEEAAYQRRLNDERWEQDNFTAWDRFHDVEADFDYEEEE